MSFTIHGIGVSGGIAIGQAQLMTHTGLEVQRYAVAPQQASEESARFDAAVNRVRAEFAELRASMPATGAKRSRPWNDAERFAGFQPMG